VTADVAAITVTASGRMSTVVTCHLCRGGQRSEIKSGGGKDTKRIFRLVLELVDQTCIAVALLSAGEREFFERRGCRYVVSCGYVVGCGYVVVIRTSSSSATRSNSGTPDRFDDRRDEFDTLQLFLPIKRP
jgi:hypothetical protein